MDCKWFVLKAGQELGPYHREDLRDLVASGQLRLSDRVYPEDPQVNTKGLDTVQDVLDEHKAAKEQSHSGHSQPTQPRSQVDTPAPDVSFASDQTTQSTQATKATKATKANKSRPDASAQKAHSNSPLEEGVSSSVGFALQAMDETRSEAKSSPKGAQAELGHVADAAKASEPGAVPDSAEVAQEPAQTVRPVRPQGHTQNQGQEPVKQPPRQPLAEAAGKPREQTAAAPSPEARPASRPLNSQVGTSSTARAFAPDSSGQPPRHPVQSGQSGQSGQPVQSGRPGQSSQPEHSSRPDSPPQPVSGQHEVEPSKAAESAFQGIPVLTDYNASPAQPLQSPPAQRSSSSSSSSAKQPPAAARERPTPADQGQDSALQGLPEQALKLPKQSAPKISSSALKFAERSYVAGAQGKAGHIAYLSEASSLSEDGVSSYSIPELDFSRNHKSTSAAKQQIRSSKTRRTFWVYNNAKQVIGEYRGSEIVKLYRSGKIPRDATILKQGYSKALPVKYFVRKYLASRKKARSGRSSSRGSRSQVLAFVQQQPLVVAMACVVFALLLLLLHWTFSPETGARRGLRSPGGQIQSGERGPRSLQRQRNLRQNRTNRIDRTNRMNRMNRTNRATPAQKRRGSPTRAQPR